MGRKGEVWERMRVEIGERFGLLHDFGGRRCGHNEARDAGGGGRTLVLSWWSRSSNERTIEQSSDVNAIREAA